MPQPSMSKFREQLDKRYGDRLTAPPAQAQYEIISTGSLTLDLALRTGGWVRGRTHEIVGPPQVCKTTLSILTAAEHQKATKKAVGWIDMEQSFDFAWARTLGLDTSEKMFTHIYPDDSEDVSDLNKILAQSELYGLLVIDSIGGMESRKAFEKDADESTMGRNAQVITRMVKQAAALARQHNITMIYVNQLRANLSYAGQDLPSGPRALQYNTTTSIRLSRKGGPIGDTTRKLKEGDVEDEVGRQFVAKVTRNRVAPAGRSAEFWLFNQPTQEYGPVGIDKVDEAVTVGVRTGVIKQSGAFYTLPGQSKSVQGRTKLVAEMKNHPEVVARIRTDALKLTAHEVKEPDDE
jgi:recombination protein RecA